ncbi:MAG: hypothetical protein JXQ72_12580 [Anaerolineae bacterium]|nr:hypothetical protein [Anaerolineae bacterium]
MKRLLLHNPITNRLKRSQRGQSIVLMAFAFIALVGFVGLVTDVALLFVRYAALRRAVDSAAIAAAGQIREGTDYGEVSVAAQQYIALHNLEADSILVETCETDIYQWRTGLGPWDGDPHPESLYPRVQEHMPETELCNWDDPHKLVRVSAQIDSPTTFLGLLGIGAVTLEATSVSETAVLDIALVIDTSESMSKETTELDYAAVGVRFPYDGGSNENGFMRDECFTKDFELDDGSVLWPYQRERWAACCNDPGHGNVGDGRTQSNGVTVPNGLIWHDENGNGMYDGDFEKGLENTVPQSSSLAAEASPDQYNFTTLICDPFKDVKDAARMFIKQLDFVRGDRVALVTFDRAGVVYDPDGANPIHRPLIRSEDAAITTLNTQVGVMINPNGLHNFCGGLHDYDIYDEWARWLNGEISVPPLRPYSYEALAHCGNTNVGGGILAANNALTDPLDIRREAVWVMIVLSDGAANVTNPVSGATDATSYGFYGYCPWWTFCPTTGLYAWGECTSGTPPNNPSQTEYESPICNDNNPDTRHFCLDWDSGDPITDNPECTYAGHYDADDYARDMADLAGLIEVDPITGKQGNFIAMFSIGFGAEAANEPTAAPLLRYIADAGDNGFIDNNLQQDLREDRNPIPSYPIGGPYPNSYGEPGPCEGVVDSTEQCGQYYYATDLNSLTEVFEEIAGRLFTRLSR